MARGFGRLSLLPEAICTVLCAVVCDEADVLRDPDVVTPLAVDVRDIVRVPCFVTKAIFKAKLLFTLFSKPCYIICSQLGVMDLVVLVSKWRPAGTEIGRVRGSCMSWRQDNSIAREDTLPRHHVGRRQVVVIFAARVQVAVRLLKGVYVLHLHVCRPDRWNSMEVLIHELRNGLGTFDVSYI